MSARGIDIPDVDIVVNYDLPEVAENYVHRVGRTGRGIKKGLAVSFCSSEEKEILAQIEEFLGHEIPVLEVDMSLYNQIVFGLEGKLSAEKLSARLTNLTRRSDNWKSVPVDESNLSRISV